MTKTLNIKKQVVFFFILILFSSSIISCGGSNILEKTLVEYSDLVLLKKNRKFSTVVEALNIKNPLFNVTSSNDIDFSYKGVKYKRFKLYVKVGEDWNYQTFYGIDRRGNSNSSTTITKSKELITYNVICDTNGLIVDWFTLLEAKNGNTDFDYELIKNYID